MVKRLYVKGKYAWEQPERVTESSPRPVQAGNSTKNPPIQIDTFFIFNQTLNISVLKSYDFFCMLLLVICVALLLYLIKIVIKHVL